MPAPADANTPERTRRRESQSQADRRHLDWTVQARTTVHDARRYTRFVGIMKRALLVAAAALLLAVAVYALLPRDTGRYAMTLERLAPVANDLTMAKPRLMGSDSDGSPFVVTADKAIQDPKDIHRARLYKVEADMTAKDGAWYNLRAPHGFLDSTAQRLWLNGNLALFSDGGYEMHTQAAFVDLAPACDPHTGKVINHKAKPGKPPPRCSKVTVRGDSQVTGQGPFGTMRADRFHIEKATKHVYLNGNVHMVLYPAHGPSSTKKPSKRP